MLGWLKLPSVYTLFSVYPWLPGHAYILADGGKCRHLSAAQKFVSLSTAAAALTQEPLTPCLMSRLQGLRSVYEKAVGLRQLCLQSITQA